MAGGWTRSEIEALADDRSFARGLGYHRDGRVELVEVGTDWVLAVVRGTSPYHVQLDRRPRVRWSCSCPMGEDGTFCKHCVAVGLQVAAPGGANSRTGKSSTAGEVDLGAYVATLDKDELVGLVIEQAEADWRLGERLHARALAAAGGTVDISSWKRRIDSAFGGRRFIDYAEAPSWAAGVFEVLEALDDLRIAGHAAAVVSLVEHANRRADKAMQRIDDSDGWLTDISGRLADLHLRACAEAQPDPLALGRRLAKLELSGDLDTFHRAAARYAALLGPGGIAEFRSVVEPTWRSTTNDEEPRSYASFRATQAMIGVGLGAGDPDLLIAIHSGDPRLPDDYLEIAELLLRAGRRDEALAWAWKGLERFAERSWQTPPLREFLAAELRADNDAAGVEALWLNAFERQPSLDSYRRMVAEAADAESSRRSAIALLRHRLGAGLTERGAHDPFVQRPPATVLVAILLYEGQVDDAWDAAQTYGCDERTLMTLARAREESHPLEVLPIYERAMEAQIDTKRNGGYRAAVDLLDRICVLAISAGEPERFTDVLTRVTTEHARKRNLIALIDKRPWR